MQANFRGDQFPQNANGQPKWCSIEEQMDDKFSPKVQLTLSTGHDTYIAKKRPNHRLRGKKRAKIFLRAALIMSSGYLHRI